jgi:hypothetical protein
VNLQEQGFRFVWRPALRECLWCAPALVQPGDVDCTDMSDREFEQFLSVRITGRLTP